MPIRSFTKTPQHRLVSIPRAVHTAAVLGAEGRHGLGHGHHRHDFRGGVPAIVGCFVCVCFAGNEGMSRGKTAIDGLHQARPQVCAGFLLPHRINHRARKLVRHHGARPAWCGRADQRYRAPKTYFSENSMTPAIFQLPDQGTESARLRVLSFSFAFALHAALAVWITPEHLNASPEPAPIRLDVRTIELPPPSALVVPLPIVELPSPLPPTARPVIRRPAAVRRPPVLAAPPVPVASPPVPVAPPSTDPAPATFAVSPPSPQEIEPQAPSIPAPVTAVRFDASYLQNPAPAYPALSRKWHEQGKVLLQVKVTATGIAEHVEIKRSSGYPRLDEAALNAVRQWRFVPARRGDGAVAASVLVPIVFRLDS